MRKDDPELESGRSPEVAKEPGRTPIGVLWLGLLGVLMVGTVLALFSVSAWLVGPYLLLMAWLLGAPARGRFETRTRDRLPVPRSGPPRPESGESNAPRPEPPPPVETEGDTAEPSEQEVPPPKPRKGRGRGRKPAKASAPPPEPVAVSWVQVGPGQFVRVEATHASMENSVESHDPTTDETEASPEVEAVSTDSPDRGSGFPDPDPGPDGTSTDSLETLAESVERPPAPEPADEVREASRLQALTPAPEEEVASTPPEDGPPSPEESSEPKFPEAEAHSEPGPQTTPATESETVDGPSEAASDEPELHAETVLLTSQPQPANEPEAADEPGDENGSDDEANHEEEEALAGPEVGEGDLPQAGPFEDQGAGPEGESPDGPASDSEEAPEFDGESRLSFPPETSLSPTPARVPRWPVWLPRGRSRRNRRNVRGPQSAAVRPSRVRTVPRQAQGPRRRRRRSWHGALRYEARAPPGPIVRRPPGVRRVVRVPHPRGTIRSEAGQAA